MNNRRIIALALCALLLILSGCSLIEVDEDLQQQKENAKVLLEYKGEKITKEYVTMRMNAELAAYNQSLEDLMANEDTFGPYIENYIRQLSVFHLALDQAAALGLDQLSPEETAEVDQKFEAGMEEAKNFADYYAQMLVNSDSTLDYDQEYDRQLEYYLNAKGYISATYRAQLEREYIFDKVKEHFLDHIEVTEDAIKSYYDTNVEMQQFNYETNPAFFEMQRSFGLVFYYPEGYVSVKHILVYFDTDTRLEAIKAYNDGDMTLYDSVIEEGMNAIQPKLDDIMARLEAGESFDALMEEYNEDTSFDQEPYKTKGSVLGPDTDVSIPGYLEAVSGLKEGQYTQPVATQVGAYIIRIEKDLEGVVPYDYIRDDVYDVLMDSRRDLEWGQLTNTWYDDAVADGTVKTYASRF